jgi:hypothetical protein
MPATILDQDKAFEAANAVAEGDRLWLTADELVGATGWELKQQGLCRGEVCVPIPPSQRTEFLHEDRVNLAALAGAIERPLVHDERHATWLLGQAAATMNARRFGSAAPDFTLPDLDGNLHKLSDYRGKKVLLMSWASW